MHNPVFTRANYTLSQPAAWGCVLCQGINAKSVTQEVINGLWVGATGNYSSPTPALYSSSIG